MGIIFSNKANKTTVGEMLNKGNFGRMILGRLQAGRVVDNGVNRPYRLNAEELEKFKDEVIFYEANDEGIYYAHFEKPVNEIREILGLAPQNPFDIF